MKDGAKEEKMLFKSIKKLEGDLVIPEGIRIKRFLSIGQGDFLMSYGNYMLLLNVIEMALRIGIVNSQNFIVQFLDHPVFFETEDDLVRYLGKNFYSYYQISRRAVVV